MKSKEYHPWYDEHKEIYHLLKEIGICTTCRLRWATSHYNCERCRKLHVKIDSRYYYEHREEILAARKKRRKRK